MPTDILLLSVLVGISLLAYMIAINSHGATRLSISYLLATLILAGTVWAIVQYVNFGQDQQKVAELRRLEHENKRAEERIRTQEITLEKKRERARIAAGVNGVITQGTGIATTMMNVNFRDLSLELDGLTARATETRRRVDQLKKEFQEIDTTRSAQEAFSESLTLVREALDLLTEAARFYVLYYRAEDSAQEEARERAVRQKARTAYERLLKAGALVASPAA